MFWLAAAALIVAGSGPVHLHSERVFLTPGLDLMIVLDESPSMAVRDYGETTRFTAARGVIGDFMRGRENDRNWTGQLQPTGVLRMPKTLDRTSLITTLEQLRVMTLETPPRSGWGSRSHCCTCRTAVPPAA